MSDTTSSTFENLHRNITEFCQICLFPNGIATLMLGTSSRRLNKAVETAVTASDAI